MIYLLTYEQFESDNEYDNKVYYHGTTKKNADNIRKIGFYPEHNVNIIDDYDEALSYAISLAEDLDDIPEVIEVLLKKNANPKADHGIDAWAYDSNDVKVIS